MVSETELMECLWELLSTSDLETTTPISVRLKLEEDLGIDLSDRKSFIRAQIHLYCRSQIRETDENGDQGNKGGVESSNGKSRNLLSDGDHKRCNSVLRHNTKAFDCGAPGSSKGHIHDVGLSESMPLAKNISTSDHVDNDTLGTQKQQHFSEKSRRKMSKSSTEACKKQKITTTTTPAQPTPPSPARGTFEQDHFSDKQSKDEEKEEADKEDPWKSGVDRKSGKNVPFAVTMTDQDVFDCPVCFEKLTNNVYQCENGHIACDSCRVKINKICPTCSCPIGYRCRGLEKVLEAIQVPCVNAEHGCQQVISYSKIRDHEDLCTYLPCSCPIRKCDFKGTGSNLYQHFDEKHMEKAVIFRFRYGVSVSLKREKKHIVLREKASGTLFVVKLFSVPLGKVISVVLIGPKSYSGKYRYVLTAKDDGGTPPVEMHSLVESVPSLADYRPTRCFLVIEDGISQLNFDIRIRPN